MMNRINNFFKGPVDRFEKLEIRQKQLILILVFTVMLSAYFNLFYKERAAEINIYRSELTSLNNKMISLKSQMPDIKTEKAVLVDMKKRNDLLKKELLSLEDELPKTGRIPQFLGELVRQTDGLSVDFISVRPKTAKGESKYDQLTVELKFNCPYQHFVNYLNRLESLSKFIYAHDVVMERASGASQDGTQVTLNLYTLLGEGDDAPADGSKKAFAENIELKRDPFSSDSDPGKPTGENEKYKISGITLNGKQPTAIINGEVYRVGEILDKKIVKQILPNMVILTEGGKSTVLVLEKNR